MLTRHYGTGYGQAGRENQNLPTHIICKGRCGRVKAPDCYSGKQLDILLKKLRDSPGLDARKMPYIVCTSDTSQQVVELECCKCDRWMGLDKFTKVQRKTPDTAECMACVKERVEMEAYEVGRDDDDGDRHGSDEGRRCSSDDEEDYDDRVDGATSKMSTMSVSGNPSTFPSQSGASSNGGRGGVNLASSTAPTSRRATSTKTASVAGTVSTTRTVRSKFDPSRYGGSTKSSGGGAWAKVPAGRRKSQAKAGSDDDEDDEDRNIIDDSD